MVMHLGPFLHKHKFIGRASEEGIEAVHAKLATEITNHKMPSYCRLKNALKYVAIDVLLHDSGKLSI